MVKWLTHVGYAWRRHGPIGLFWLIGYNIAYHVSRRGRQAAVWTASWVSIRPGAGQIT